MSARLLGNVIHRGFYWVVLITLLNLLVNVSLKVLKKGTIRSWLVYVLTIIVMDTMEMRLDGLHQRSLQEDNLRGLRLLGVSLQGLKHLGDSLRGLKLPGDSLRGRRLPGDLRILLGPILIGFCVINVAAFFLVGPLSSFTILDCTLLRVKFMLRF